MWSVSSQTRDQTRALLPAVGVQGLSPHTSRECAGWDSELTGQTLSRCGWRGPERPWDGKETQPVLPKGDQSWVFTGRADAEAEPPILWPPDAKS